MKNQKSIVDWDIDETTYIGDGDKGCYFQTGPDRKNRWYVTVCWEDQHTFEEFITDDGPYSTEDEARLAGENAAIEWCINNDVDYTEGGDE